jgi:predicted O-methyltransferase YrrM
LPVVGHFAAARQTVGWARRRKPGTTVSSTSSAKSTGQRSDAQPRPRGRLRAWFERRRPAPLDVLAPAMQWGRFKTWINALLLRPALLRSRRRAWEIYEPLRKRLDITWEMLPSDRTGRFAGHILDADLPRPARYLEIGSYEGDSIAFVDALLGGQMRATAIDPFMDYSELGGRDMSDVYAKFVANVAAIGATDRVRVLRGRSIDHLPKLIDAGERFDLIFIDGSHANLDVMIDAALAWQVLARGGLMIFDDYWYRRPDLGPAFRPKLAIDAFVGAMSHEIDVLDVAGQVFIRRK